MHERSTVSILLHYVLIQSAISSNTGPHQKNNFILHYTRNCVICICTIQQNGVDGYEIECGYTLKRKCANNSTFGFLTGVVIFPLHLSEYIFGENKRNLYFWSIVKMLAFIHTSLSEDRPERGIKRLAEQC